MTARLYAHSFILLTSAFILVLTPGQGHAQFRQDNGVPDSAFTSLGAQYTGGFTVGPGPAFERRGGLLSLRIEDSSMVGGTRNTSATYLSPYYAATAAHNILDYIALFPNSPLTITVADGPNFLTDRGRVVGVSQITYSPTVDLAILRLSDAIPGMAVSFSSVPPVFGNVVTSAGFGRPGSPSTGVLPQDGFSRGFQGVELNAPLSFYSDEFYNAYRFSPTTGLSLNGLGTSGSSGSPVFDQYGDLKGMNAFATNPRLC